MRRINFDISSFFNKQSGGDAFGSINLSDYASIKNGTYGKLLKSYYGTQKKSQSVNSTTEINKKNQVDLDSNGLTKMKKEADALKTAAETLTSTELWRQEQGEYNKDKIFDAVKDFAGKYNSVLSQSDKVNSKDIAQTVGYMTSMTNTMSKALSAVGIQVEADGKLTVKEEELQKADMGKLKTLFKGVSSYGAQIENKAGEISRDAVMSSSIYGSNGTVNSSLSGLFNKWI